MAEFIMHNDIHPRTVLVGMLISILIVYLVERAFNDMSLVDPTVMIKPELQPQEVADIKSAIEFKCVNGIAYYRTNKKWIKTNSMMGNPCYD